MFTIACSIFAAISLGAIIAFPDMHVPNFRHSLAQVKSLFHRPFEWNLGTKNMEIGDTLDPPLQQWIAK
jgi:hypothetical protein